MFAAVAVSLGAAYALYRLVEFPALRAAASLRYSSQRTAVTGVR
jgi:peptidoglycan/LPS O-acetylase OafA/YrhL